jgi:hypothetical protein
MPVIFLISTLKPGISKETYEKWVHERDYPFVARLPNVRSYKVHRIKTEIQGAPDAGWAYIERIEVKDRAQHERDLSTPEGMALREELYSYLDRPKNIYFVSDIV